MRHAFLGACVLAAACRAQPHVSRNELTDDWDRRVALAAPARRIVSLAPATTELVFALGLGDRLVGRTTWDDWPPAVRAVPDVGAGIGPNLEAIVARRPDLVLVYPSDANRAAVTRLTGLGIPVAALRQDRVADWRRAARWIARAAGVPDRADSLLADFDRRLAAVRRAPAPGAPVVVVVAQLSPPVVIGAGSFLSELVQLAGARNAFGDIASPSAEVGFEAIVARRPDAVLVLGPEAAAAGLSRREGWRAVPAVHAGRVIAVDGAAFDRPSVRLPEAVAALAAKLARLGPRAS